MTYPDGKKAVYTYDAMNRLISVKGADGKKTTYTYDLLGQRISTDGEKEDTAYTYDEVGNLISQVTTGKYDAGIETPKYDNAAHHIVAGGSPKTEVARIILERFGIGINDVENGVFLPIEKVVTDAAYHP